MHREERYHDTAAWKLLIRAYALLDTRTKMELWILLLIQTR